MSTWLKNEPYDWRALEVRLSISKWGAIMDSRVSTDDHVAIPKDGVFFVHTLTTEDLK